VKRLRIATRESPLALWQAEFISAQLRALEPGLDVELVKMRTQGDRWLSSPLSEVGGKGLFIKELEQAMLDGRADAAVHSMKDVPAVLPDGFVLGAVGFRDDVRDVLVGTGDGLEGLRDGAVVGSSSLRRQSQLLSIRPDLDVRPIRGNVGTRLGKLEAGEFDAIVLAAAGLRRLGIVPRAATPLAIEQSLPAAGQAALGVECLADSGGALALIERLNDAKVSEAVRAERLVSEGLGADCSMPLAAHAQHTPSGLWLRARLASADGSRMLVAEQTAADAGAASSHVVRQLIDQGARDILAALQ
jgi:hydroxymethylbilane synthase